MEKKAATLQTMYRKVFETDITVGDMVIAAKRQRRDVSAFASVDSVLSGLESRDDSDAYAA